MEAQMVKLDSMMVKPMVDGQNVAEHSSVTEFDRAAIEENLIVVNFILIISTLLSSALLLINLSLLIKRI